MPAAMNRRLPLRDAVCDKEAIYMDAQAIALRPYGLSDAAWAHLCVFLCGAGPKVDKLTFTPAPVNDPEVWARLDAYLTPMKKSFASQLRAEPSLRGLKRRLTGQPPCL